VDFQNGAVLFHADGELVDRSRKCVSDFLPMEDLATVQRLLEIEIGRNDLHGGSSPAAAGPLSVKLMAAKPRLTNIARQSARSHLAQRKNSVT
jgi:hypothetical protein